MLQYKGTEQLKLLYGRQENILNHVFVKNEGKMLYNIIMISRAGLPIFQKQFLSNGKIKPMLSGIISGMNIKCRKIVGAACSYLEFDSISMAIATNKKYGISCLLIYEKSDGEEFGKLIATELIQTFCLEYGDYLVQQKNAKGIEMDLFLPFENKISSAIWNSLTPVLQFLQSQKGINLAVLLSGDQILPFNHRVDAISFLSQYRSLMFQTKQIMAVCNENDNQVLIQLKQAQDAIIIVRKIENASLVVSISNTSHFNRKLTYAMVDKYSFVLASIIKLNASLGTTYNAEAFKWGVL